MSFRMVSNESAEERIVPANSCCSWLSGVFTSRLAIPTTLFMGVRISWLILARNSDFAALAISAARRADRTSLVCQINSPSAAISTHKAPIR